MRITFLVINEESCQLIFNGYNSIDIHVFVSCPGDVKAEKKKAREACERLTNIMLANRDEKNDLLACFFGTGHY